MAQSSGTCFYASIVNELFCFVQRDWTIFLFRKWYERVGNFYFNLKLYERRMVCTFYKLEDIGRCKIKEVNDDEKSFVREIHRKCNISRFLFTKRSLVKSLCPYRSMKFRHWIAFERRKRASTCLDEQRIIPKLTRSKRDRGNSKVM